MPADGKPGSRSAGTLTDIFDSHLAHLFDYCRALLGQEAEAAHLARAVLDSAQPLLSDPDRLRSWIFATARRHALALRPAGTEQFSYAPLAVPLALAAQPGRQPDDGVLRAFSGITGRDREILDLVYRHGIRPRALPDVLGIPTVEAYHRLAVAEEEFVTLLKAGAGLEEIAALPLAAPPAWAKRHGGRLWRRRHRRPAQLVTAAVIPAAQAAVAPSPSTNAVRQRLGNS